MTIIIIIIMIIIIMIIIISNRDTLLHLTTIRNSVTSVTFKQLSCLSFCSPQSDIICSSDFDFVCILNFKKYGKISSSFQVYLFFSNINN